MSRANKKYIEFVLRDVTGSIKGIAYKQTEEYENALKVR